MSEPTLTFGKRVQFTLRWFSGEFQAVGEELTVDDVSGFVLHKLTASQKAQLFNDDHGAWRISDVTTGARAASGGTREEALQSISGLASRYGKKFAALVARNRKRVLKKADKGKRI